LDGQVHQNVVHLLRRLQATPEQTILDHELLVVRDHIEHVVVEIAQGDAQDFSLHVPAPADSRSGSKRWRRHATRRGRKTRWSKRRRRTTFSYDAPVASDFVFVALARPKGACRGGGAHNHLTIVHFLARQASIFSTFGKTMAFEQRVVEIIGGLAAGTVVSVRGSKLYLSDKFLESIRPVISKIRAVVIIAVNTGGLLELERGVDLRLSVILRQAAEIDGPMTDDGFSAAVQAVVSTFDKEAVLPVIVSCSDPVGTGIFLQRLPWAPECD
jgi:hypothetical protein